MSSKTHYWKAFDRRRGRFQVWGRRRFQLALMKQYMAWNTRFRDAQTTGELLGAFDMPQGPISESFNEVYVRVGQAFAKEQGDEFKSTHGYRVKDAPTASVSATTSRHGWRVNVASVSLASRQRHNGSCSPS